MSKRRIAILMSGLLVLALTASAFAELVVTYTSSDDGFSEYTINDSDRRKSDAAVNSVIDNGDFTVWGTSLGPSDPWTFWRDGTAGWTAGRLHEFDLANHANAEGINNAMGWFIQHSGATSGGYYAGAWQPLSRITHADDRLYYVTVSTTAFSDGKTGPYNSVAWYAISDYANPAEVTEWKELFPDQFVCNNGDEVCNYVGRDETVPIHANQYFHLQVGRKFPEFFGWTMFIIDDISIVSTATPPTVTKTADDGTEFEEAVETENGFFNWCNDRPEDIKFHESEDCDGFTEVHWDAETPR